MRDPDTRVSVSLWERVCESGWLSSRLSLLHSTLKQGRTGAPQCQRTASSHGVTAEPRVQSPHASCDKCGGKNGTVVRSSPVTFFCRVLFHRRYTLTDHRRRFVQWAPWTEGQASAACASTFQKSKPERTFILICNTSSFLLSFFFFVGYRNQWRVQQQTEKGASGTLHFQSL